MKFLVVLFIVIPALLILALAFALFAMFQSQPLVQRPLGLTPERIAEGKRILDANDPRKLKPGEVRTVTFSQTDLDLALNYLAQHVSQGGANLVLLPGGAQVLLTAQFPQNPLGAYLNIDASLAETGGWPRFERLRIGSLGIPARLADWLLGKTVQAAGSQAEFQVLKDVVKQVRVADGKLEVTYEWQKDLTAKLSGMLIPPAEQERLRAYQQGLAETLAKTTPKNAVSLAELMQPVFKLAESRSQGGDPVAENRAALLALTFYVQGKDWAKIIPQAQDWPKPPRRRVKLAGRDDFPKHLIISAALAANAGGPLSDAVGLYKEVDDSRAGSGFSFNDIAADRAGVRLGERATESPDSARKLQQTLGFALREADFMPSVAGLPEFMPEAEFKARFGGIGEPAYQQMMEEIEKRVAALAINR